MTQYYFISHNYSFISPISDFVYTATLFLVTVPVPHNCDYITIITFTSHNCHFFCHNEFDKIENLFFILTVTLSLVKI